MCDLLDARRTAAVVRAAGPEVVINVQALSDVDRCEQDPAAAEALNVQATQHLTDVARAVGSRLIHVSTDYVFDGAATRPYDEQDATRPLSVYGRTKLAGERIVLGYDRSLVVRTSTLFGLGRSSFCDAAAQRLRSGEVVSAFRDQTTSPTYADDLAEGLLALAQMRARPPSRVFHVVNAGGCTRVEFARAIAQALGVAPERIRPIAMAEQRRPAPRPAFSALTSSYLDSYLGRRLRPWQDGLLAYLHQRHWTA